MLSQVRGGTNLNYSYSYVGKRVTKPAVSPTGGSSETRYFDAAQRTTRITGQGYDTTAQCSADGQISSLTQTAPGNTASNTTAFGYDDAGRLTSAGATSYSWDADGNRTAAAGITESYNEANHLTETSDGKTYTYDADGNLTDAGTTHYEYNAFGELVSAVTASSTVAYVRDALGRAAGNSSDQLSYEGFSNDLTQYRAGSTRTDVVRDPTGGLLATSTQGGSSSRAWQTIHGDLAMTTNATNGAVQHTAVYDPSGKPTTTGTASVPFGFQTMFTDPVTGLADMGARNYDAATGRLTTVDTVAGDLASPITLNRYTPTATPPRSTSSTPTATGAFPAGTRSRTSSALPSTGSATASTT